MARPLRIEFARTLLIIFLLSSAMSACTQNQQYQHQFDNSEPLPVTNCRVIIHTVEQIIGKAGVQDTQDRRINDFSYLRVNRFLSSFHNKVFDEKFMYWAELLRKNGVTGWLVELKNLPTHYKNELHKRTVNLGPKNKTIESKLTACSQTVSQYDLKSINKRKQLRQNAIVPSEYNLWQQVFGLYPLMAIPIRMGIYRWHQETVGIFKQTQFSLPTNGKLTLFTRKDEVKKFSQQNVTEIIKKSSHNALQIPILTGTQQQILFNAFAPTFEINVNSDNDKIGKPEWVDKKNIINTKKPIVYKHVSHTRFFDKTLLQLNYIIWFPSRPKTSRFDLLGGHLDGIVWRVTLDTKGEPLMYDSIHMCGCYHLFFPTRKLSIKQSSSFFMEPDFIPQEKVNFIKGHNPIIRISANKHYIQQVYWQPAVSKFQTHYQLEKADSLRSLNLPNNQFQSLYSQNSFILNSERGERYLFWPMGVPNAGAMRQWGHHATAFVGRRHFDDARLFENSFEFVESNR